MTDNTNQELVESLESIITSFETCITCNIVMASIAEDPAEIQRLEDENDKLVEACAEIRFNIDHIIE